MRLHRIQHSPISLLFLLFLFADQYDVLIYKAEAFSSNPRSDAAHPAFHWNVGEGQKNRLSSSLGFASMISSVTIERSGKGYMDRSSLNLYSQVDSIMEEDSLSNVENSTLSSKLDEKLQFLTNLFPIFVVFAAMLGATCPQTLLWVSRGNLVTIFLASVMTGTGMTLTKDDFAGILSSGKSARVIPIGVMCQYGIMPLSAWLVSKVMILNGSAGLSAASASALFLGLTLVGCSPGGTASNLVSLIAGADVVLSVLLTSCSTILAAALTPLFVKLLVAGTTVDINGLVLCMATAKVVLGPVALGMLLNEKAPGVSKSLSRFTPFASVVLVALICGGVVAQNAASGLISNGFDPLTRLLILSVVLLHSLGFFGKFL